jgi:shikimate kinase
MSDPVSSFEQMYETRLPVYESIQAFKVDTRNKSEQDILQILVDLIEVIKASHGE